MVAFTLLSTPEYYVIFFHITEASEMKKIRFIQFLLYALDNELYEELRWCDREEGTFYIEWIHKTSRRWSKKYLKLFIDYAALKGNLNKKLNESSAENHTKI